MSCILNRYSLFANITSSFFEPIQRTWRESDKADSHPCREINLADLMASAQNDVQRQNITKDEQETMWMYLNDEVDISKLDSILGYALKHAVNKRELLLKLFKSVKPVLLWNACQEHDK